ncbi:MAG: oligosaccharide flippase family protein [Myxococcota bacterium]
MSSRLISGIFSSWAGFLVSALTSLLMAPHLVRTLGDDGYGLWCLYMSITGYFALLDFGVSPAIVRYTSKYQALGDSAAEQRVVAAGLGFFLLTAGGLCLLALGAYSYYDVLFPVPQVSLEVARQTFLLVSLDFALVLPCAVFQGVLLGHQRFFALNLLNMLLRLLRFALVMTTLEAGSEGLVGVALIFFVTGLLRDLAYVYLARQVLGGLPNPLNTHLHTVRELLSYSLPAFIISISLRVQSYTDALVIGYVVGVGAITPFALAGSLVDYVQELGWGLTGVLVPVVSAHEAKGEHAAIQTQFLKFTRYCVWLMIPILAGAEALGRSFFIRWVGPEYGQSAELLRILLWAMTIYVVQLPAQAVLKGMGRHQTLARFLGVEAIANLGLSIWWGQLWGVEGVALGTLVPRLLLTGGLLTRHVLQVLKLPLMTLASAVVRPALPGALVMTTLTWLHGYLFREPLSWLGLILSGGLFIAVYVVTTYTLALPPEEKRWLEQRVQAQLQRLR